MTTKKRTIRKNVPQKYFQLIADIYNSQRANKKFDMQEYLKEKKISRGAPMAMCELKLMQKTGYDRWFWIAGIPSMKMALDIIENLRLKSEKYNPNKVVVTKPFKEDVLDRKAVRKTNLKTEIPIQKNVFKISLFWGLINFQKN
jgi:hypothetical protein